MNGSVRSIFRGHLLCGKFNGLYPMIGLVLIKTESSKVKYNGR